MSWEKVKLSEVIEPPISGEWGDEGTGVSVIRTTNFSNDGCLDLTDVVSRNIQPQKVEKKKLIFGDTILEKSGGSPNQPVGRVVYFNVKDDDRIFLCNNFTSVLRPKSNVNPRYLFWFLFNNHVTKKTLRYQNKTTGIINLQTERYLKELSIPLPPLETQQQIAAILDKADALRKKDKQLLTHYDELLQSIFHDMFGDPVKNEKGWDTLTIEEMASMEKHSIKRGPFGGALKKEIFVGDGYLVYEQFHALNNDFSFARYFIDEKKYQELIAFDVKPGDVIISCSGVYLGKLAIVPPNARPGIINQALLKLNLDNKKYRSEFFIEVFGNKNFKEKYFPSERGVAIPNFPPMESFRKFKFIAPSIKLQDHFVEITKNINHQKQQVKQQMVYSENLFQSLLQRAFKGELVA